MELAVVVIPSEFVTKHLKNLDGAAVKVFLFISMYTFGDMEATRPVLKQEIAVQTGLSEKGVYNAIQELIVKKLIVMTRRKGRGARNGFRVNLTRYSLPGNEYEVKKGAIHGSEIPISINNQPVGSPVPPSAVASASPSRSDSAGHQRKRSNEEVMTFKRLWTAFETAYGQKLTGSRHAKDIWSLMDRVKERVDGAKHLEEMVKKFFEILKTKPKGKEFISSQLPLPGILNGKIWEHIESMVSPKKEEKEMPEWKKREVERWKRERAALDPVKVAL